MKKPNIITIVIDDMGWRDLACYGSSFYETPCIDKLTRAGVLFTNAYAPSPVCSPSRASLLTGKYPATNGVTNWIGADAKGRLLDAPYRWHMDKNEYTLPQALQDHGYAAWHVGKWHLGEEEYYPEKSGFAVNIGGCEWGYPKTGYFGPFPYPAMEGGPEGEFLNDRLTDEAIRLIQNKKPEQPFYLNLCHYAVHIPIQAPEELVEKYRRKKHALRLDETNPFAEGEHYPCDHKKDQRVTRRLFQSDETYAALIENLDTNIGRLTEALRAQGELENTVLIFLSDNGGLSTAEGAPTCNAPLREGKGWATEGGVRIPFWVVAPGCQKGLQTDEIVSIVDIYPTILSLAGIIPRQKQALEGIDFSPALQGQALPERPVFWHYPHYGNQGGTPHSAVRLGEWKLIEYFEDGHLELYQLDRDIAESEDLATQYPQKRAELFALLKDWRGRVGAVLPLPNPEYGD